MKRPVFLSIFLIVFTLYGFCYNERLPIKWGRIAKSEFEIKSFRGDTSVDAIILCDFGDISITNRTFYTRHVRIKILNSKGLKYATVEIPYQARDKHDDILALKAQTYNLENGEIVKYKLKSREYSDLKVDDKWRKKVIKLPNVSPGSIIEYYYNIASLDFIRLDEWYFQSEIPTLWSEIRFDVPAPFMYLVTYRKGKTLSAIEENELSKKLEWLYNTKKLKRRVELAKNDRVLYESADKNYRLYVINNMKKKIIMRNLAGIKSADGFVSVKDYYPKLKFHLFESSGRLPWIYRPLIFSTLDDYETKSKWELWHSYRQTGYIHYQLDTWVEMNDKMLESDLFGMQLIKHFNYLPIFDSILKDKHSSREKMIAIYDFVSQKMNWNGKYSVYLYNGLTEPFNKKTGTSSEINMLMIYLLKRAGLDADPVLLRTSDLGMVETVYPVHNQFNHVIAMVSIEGQIYLLDAIDPTKPFNILPEKDLFTKGWIVNKNNYGWLNLRENTSAGERSGSSKDILNL